MRLNPYLNFDGQCAEAFAFYARCLNGQNLAIQTFAQSPMADQVGPEGRDKVIHARMNVGDTVLMGSDSPSSGSSAAKGFAVSLSVDSAEEAERVFHDMADGGQIQMPIGETFWAVRFGMFTDRFGIPWMVNYERPAAA